MEWMQIEAKWHDMARRLQQSQPLSRQISGMDKAESAEPKATPDTDRLELAADTQRIGV